jgi:hypothetical protein
MLAKWPQHTIDLADHVNTPWSCSRNAPGSVPQYEMFCKRSRGKSIKGDADAFKTLSFAPEGFRRSRVTPGSSCGVSSYYCLAPSSAKLTPYADPRFAVRSVDRPRPFSTGHHCHDNMSFLLARPRHSSTGYFAVPRPPVDIFRTCVHVGNGKRLDMRYEAQSDRYQVRWNRTIISGSGRLPLRFRHVWKITAA